MAELVIEETNGKKLKALESFLRTLDIPFKKTSSTRLDKRVEEARREKQADTLKRVDPDHLWESL